MSRELKTESQQQADGLFSHLYNIYQKLNVKSRQQAVETARGLGIV
jgi:DNA-binding CsgD family transcriptional regulator